jgi:hypothetical protein
MSLLEENEKRFENFSAKKLADLTTPFVINKFFQQQFKQSRNSLSFLRKPDLKTYDFVFIKNKKTDL